MSDVIDNPGEWVPALLRAVHRGCGRTVAFYEHDHGWTRSSARCRCSPAPVLPAGAGLAAELRAARLGRTRRVLV